MSGATHPCRQEKQACGKNGRVRGVEDNGKYLVINLTSDLCVNSKLNTETSLDRMPFVVSQRRRSRDSTMASSCSFTML